MTLSNQCILTACTSYNDIIVTRQTPQLSVSCPSGHVLLIPIVRIKKLLFMARQSRVHHATVIPRLHWPNDSIMPVYLVNINKYDRGRAR